MEKILLDIRKELEYASEKWGTEFDDKNTVNDWVSFITGYAGQASKIGNTPEEQRTQLIKTAGLALSAIDSFDRNGGFPKRHYD